MAFIGIDRDIENHWIYQDAEYFKVWFEVLLRTRFLGDPEELLIDGVIVQVGYGEFIFGRKSWSKKLGISEQRLRTLFKKLVSENMLEMKVSSNRFSKYFVVNYEKYHKINHRANHQEVAAGKESQAQPTTTPTNSQPPANHQLTTLKELKNLNNISPTSYIDPGPSQIEQHFMMKRNKGFGGLTPEDNAAVYEVLNYGIPVDFIKAIIDKAFTEYKPKYPRDAITNFTYIVPRIYQEWHSKLEKEKGVQASEKPWRPAEGVRPSSPTPASESITGGQVGWIGNSKYKSKVVPLQNVQG